MIRGRGRGYVAGLVGISLTPSGIHFLILAHRRTGITRVRINHRCGDESNDRIH